MTPFPSARRLWLCTVCVGFGILSGCGGGTSSSTPATVSNNCSLKIEALKPPCPTGVEFACTTPSCSGASCSTLSQGNWNEFNNTIPASSAVDGVNIYVPWSSIDTGAPGTASGGSANEYDFSALDQQVMYYQNNIPNKKVNLMWMAVNYGNVNDSAGGVNNMTPSYVFSTSWAGTAGASSPQDVVYCSTYPGADNLTVQYANISSPSFDSTGYPAVYEKPFVLAYQNFIQAVIKHYNGNATIGYMRFGLSVGDETDAYCTAQLQSIPAPNTFAGDPSPSTWENYLTAMVGYEHSQNPTMQLMNSLNSLDTTSDPTVLPVFEAQLAVSDSFGFGSNGLQKSDIQASQTGGTCTADWCALFDQYTGQVPLELQTATPSDPTDGGTTGSLVNLIPVVVQNHATILELALQDLYIALDPNNNPAYYGAYNSAVTNACSNQ